MDAYRLSNQWLPPELYRVDYHGSRTIYSQTEGFLAAHRTKVYGSLDINVFRRDLEKYFTWSSQVPTPFISLFSDWDHAENWGLEQPWASHVIHHRSGHWTLRVIDTRRLVEPYIFRSEDLVNSLELKLPDEAKQHTEDTFLCLYAIPVAAVVEHWDPQEVKNGIAKET